nr:hypothetical protein [Rhodoferax sp.]
MFFALFFIAGLGLGVALLYGYQRRQTRAHRRIPRDWPLAVRPLVNNREKLVWVWLAKVMFDQQVLVKLPVTRFTAPKPGTDAAHWYHLLNGVYCSFTVCSMEGQIIGCIDVPGPQGLSMSNQTLKHNLLSHCGLHYLVVDPANLPHLIQIRTAFLGEHAARGNGVNSQLESQFKDVRENLHAIVDRKRNSNGGGKSSAIAQLDATMPNTSEYGESQQLAPGWEQNSFITPLDSRAADLGN